MIDEEDLLWRRNVYFIIYRVSVYFVKQFGTENHLDINIDKTSIFRY